MWAVGLGRGSIAFGAKKKPRAMAGLKLNERYEERPDRVRARPATLVAGSRVDRNAGRRPPRFRGRPSSSVIGATGRAQRIRAAAHPPPSSVAKAHLANFSA